MILVIQKVSKAEVIDKEKAETRRIGPGLVVLICFEKGDSVDVFPKVLDKIFNLRVFEDEAGKLNLSVTDLGYEVMVVPNFTLAGNIQKGRRPSFDKASSYEESEVMFDKFLKTAKELGYTLTAGFFGRYMSVHIVNDGPVTLIGKF